MSTPNRTGTWIRNGLILILLALYVEAKIDDIWESGFAAGFQIGYEQGLEQPLRLWKSGAITGRITGSRQLGQDAPQTT